MRADTAAIRDAARDPFAVARALGLDERAKRQPSGVLVLCPWHSERNPSCSLTVGDDGTVRAKCFSCGEGGDVFSIVAAAYGLDARRDFRTVAARTADLLGVRVDAARPTRPRPPTPRAVQLAARLDAPIGSYRTRDDELERLAAECSPAERADALAIVHALDARHAEREAQLERLAAAHVDPLNRLADELERRKEYRA